jgi:hypothetical protein
MTTAIATVDGGGAVAHRQATDAAGICREVVLKTAITLQGRKYVRVEGWQAIANAYGCVASACDVEKVDGGYRATGQVRRIDTGHVIVEAEGFVGSDEKSWGSRPQYAQRAMAQTRAISRACRSAFAFVVALMDAGLETTPAEEMDAEPERPAREPVKVRPKFEEPRPEPKPEPGPKLDSADAFDAAMAAIEDEKQPAKLEAIRQRVEMRLRDKTFAAFQADQLFDAIQARLDFLEAGSEVGE